MVKPLMILPPVAFAGLALAFWMGMQNGDQALPSTMEGRQAPQVSVTPLGDGPTVTPDDLAAPGVKLVNFWASWCQPCRVEHPMLEQLAGEGVVIHGINYKDKPDDALGFLAEMGNPFSTLGADSGRMALNWGVYGVPETYVIDGTGKVVLRWAGPITEDVLEKTIRPAMARAAGS
jgi:cytochrome c biogenesis protein CcmG, thiol:disulfide interchange protein DsbE